MRSAFGENAGRWKPAVLGVALGVVFALGASGCGNSGGTGGNGPPDLATLGTPIDLSQGVSLDLAGTTPDLATQPDAAIPGGKAQPATQATGRYFPDTAPWYRDISQAPVAADSSAITQWMVGKAAPGGWGTGKMRVDFSIVAVDVPANTPRRPYAMAKGFFYSPDCDTAPVPLVPGGAVEETYGTPTVFTSPWSAYDCSGFGGGADCHVLLVSRSEKRLYEIYHATVDAQNTFTAGCLAIWDTTSVDPNGRGQQCTSADAAGFPMSPLLFSVEEVKAGTIDHAIRFILPNSMIRAKKYVAPATHGTNTSGPLTSGPYGFRMRLNKNYPVNSLSPAAQVVARALQKYGMLMADGGNIALTAQSDVLSTVKWTDVGFDSNSLSALKATDFDVIDDTPTVDVTYNCQRKPINN